MSLPMLFRLLEHLQMSYNLPFLPVPSITDGMYNYISLRTANPYDITFTIDEERTAAYKVKCGFMWFVFDEIDISPEHNELWFYMSGEFAGCIEIS